MTSITQTTKPFTFIDNWIIQRELNLPLEPERPLINSTEDYSLPLVQINIWERLVFRIATGLDLQKIREYKILHSPRFKQLAALAVHGSPDDEQSKAKANAATNLICLKNIYSSASLEAYWVDRELSVYITDLNALKETLKNHRLTWCQGKNYDPESTEFQLSMSRPIESEFSFHVMCRLEWPYLSLDYRSQYNEETDTFQLVPYEQSVNKKLGVMKAMRTQDNWMNTSLTKRLEQDFKRRQQDPHCRLLFAYNEMYEAKLKRRWMIVKASWITTFALAALAGVVFFCRLVNRSELR